LKLLAESKVLFTGGSGLLGTEFRKLLPNAQYPTSRDFDVTNYDQLQRYAESHPFEVILHAAAFTSPARIDEAPIKAIETNIIGTANIAKLCAAFDSRLIYLSTDYVFKGDRGNYKEDDPVYPVNGYAWSKLGGECSARLYDNALIVRTSFGPNVFPFDKAFVDQWTTRESVAVIARKLAALIDAKISGVIHIGGTRKTVFEYAKSLDETRDIGELSIKDVNFRVPVDTSLCCERHDRLLTHNDRETS
jgi:dTDP-4-dehydrorhamnose reductase